MNDEFLEAAHKGIPLSDYRAEKLAHLEAENERLKATIGNLLANEHWCDYIEARAFTRNDGTVGASLQLTVKDVTFVGGRGERQEQPQNEDELQDIPF